MVVESFVRQPALKVLVADVQNGTLVAGDEEQPTVLEVAPGERSGRVSMMAALVSVGDREAWIDDGSGILQLRVFDSVIWPPVGSVVHVVGRVREYGGQRYIAVEIVRGISPTWAAVRKLEIAGRGAVAKRPVGSGADAGTTMNMTSASDLVGVVDRLDDGRGADYEAIKTALGRSDAESLMQGALESGVLFQVAPGRLKVLR